MKLLLTTFRRTAQARPMVVVLYLLTLALGLPLALAFYDTAKAEGAGSLAPLAMLDGFDATVWSDLMAQSGRVFKALQRSGFWAAVLYWLLSAGLAGGILTYLYQPNAMLMDFWRGAGRYFGRLLALAVLTALLATLLFSIPFLLAIIGIALMGIADYGTEPAWFWAGFIGFLVGALLATFALCIGDYAKVRMVRDGVRNPFRAFGQAMRYVRRNKRATYGRYVLLILAGALLFGVYLLVDELILMRNWPTILIMLVVQQAVIFGRAWLKVWTLATAVHIANDWPAPVSATPALLTNVTAPIDPLPDEQTATLPPAAPERATSPDEHNAPTRVPPPLPEP